MADKDDEITVNIDDLDTVQVEVADDVDTVTAPKTSKEETKVAKEPKTAKRVSPEPEVQIAGPTPEEALAAAQAHAKTQEEARRAAEATAASERTLREQAQRQAATAQQEAEQYRERADNSELAIIENGIASATRELEAQESEYTRAAEAGEFAKMASIQTKLSKAAAALDRLENTKATLDLNAKRQPTEGRVEAQPQIQVNPLERWLSQFSPTAQSWLRMHPECADPSVGGTQAQYDAMMQGHHAALGKKLREGSPEYFKTIESHLVGGEQEEQQAAPVSRAAEVQIAGQPKPAKHVQPSAPPSRDAPATPGARNVREVRLTKEQQEMAKVSFPHKTEQEAYGLYARNLIELEAEGKIGRVTH